MRFISAQNSSKAVCLDLLAQARNAPVTIYWIFKCLALLVLSLGVIGTFTWRSMALASELPKPLSIPTSTQKLHVSDRKKEKPETSPESLAGMPALVPTPDASPSPSAMAVYPLSAGDVVTIGDVTVGALVQNAPIASDGSLMLPLVGRVHLAGLSVTEARQRLNRDYSRYYVSPQITVQLKRQHPLRIYVTGGVAHAGVYISGKNLLPDSSGTASLGNYNNQFWASRLYLTDALMMAGGLSANADARDIRIRHARAPQETIHVNLLDVLANHETARDISLSDQDVIEVPELPENQLVQNDDWQAFAHSNLTRRQFKVNVLGAVARPGFLEVQASDTIFTALAKAGGFTAVADTGHVFILRTLHNGQILRQELNLSDKKLMGHQPLTQWAALRPDDVIFVDDSTAKKTAQLGTGLMDRSATAALFPLFNRLFSGH